MTDRVPPQYPDIIPTRLAFLGQAPAEEELERGVPLVGPSGRLFNAVLRVAGLRREDFHVTNLFDEAVDNDKAIEIWRHGGDIVDYNTARLTAEFAHSAPTVIVPMGSAALYATTGLTSIMQARGTVMPATALSVGTKIVPTFHPAFILRSWNMYPVMIGDVVRAAGEAEKGPDVKLAQRRLLLEPTLDDLKEWKPKLLSGRREDDPISVDIETPFGQIACISFAPSAGEAIVVPFIDRRNPSRSYWRTAEEELEAVMFMKEIMESPEPKLGQNFSAFDAFWLWNQFGIASMNLLHDTRLLHHALYAELPKSLQFMGASYGSQGAWKGWGANNSEKRDD